MIVINGFAFHYASCFSTIYKSTQIHILKDFLFGQLTSLILCIILCFINSTIKVLFLKCGYCKCNKKFFNILKKITFFMEISLDLIYFLIMDKFNKTNN